MGKSGPKPKKYCNNGHLKEGTNLRIQPRKVRGKNGQLWITHTYVCLICHNERLKEFKLREIQKKRTWNNEFSNNTG